jgi:hypothetical protein
MAGINENMNSELAKQIVDLYSKAENEIFMKITNRLKSGLDDPLWERKKLRQIQQMRDDVLEQLSILNLKVPGESYDIINKAYTEGLNSVDADLKKQGIARTRDGQLYFVHQVGIIEPQVSIAFAKLDIYKIQALAKALTDQLLRTHPQIIRAADDIYRHVITDSVMLTMTGSGTLRDAVQSSLSKFANRGVTGFVDKGGRNWSLQAYSEMACRSNLVQANLAGTQDRMDELGINLVIVSYHPGASDLCLPFEGKILISNE